MRIEWNGSVWRGRAIDLSSSSRIDSKLICNAIGLDGKENGLCVVCSDPSDLHAHVGRITPGMTLQRHTALTVAARSRGWDAPQDEEYSRVRDRIDELSISGIDTAATRKRLAETTDEIERQRERVARLQGQVTALRERTGQQKGDPHRALERAMQELSELETQRAAAQQTLERARKRQRQLHDRHDERLALEDRAANLARAARRHLCDRIQDEFERTVESAPGTDVDPMTTALAIAHLGEISAPIVLERNRFDTLQTAADWLNAPVIGVD